MKSINCKGVLVELQPPAVMGILNLTPDSFYSESRVGDEQTLLEKAAAFLQQGATVLDLGAYSTRPGAKDITADEEKQRLLPALKTLRKAFPNAILSADTFRSEVARAAVGEGASIINDISGGTLDPDMFATVGELKVPYVLMHIQGTPQTMQEAPSYTNVVAEVYHSLSEKLQKLRALGVKDVVLDPGFGFGKTLEHNYALLNALPEFKAFNCPILVGVSRKSMINKVLNIRADEALNGTTVLHTMALERGAHILRVHDVKAAAEAVKIVTFAQNL